MAAKRGFEALRVSLPVIAFLLILIMQSSRNEVHSGRSTLTLDICVYPHEEEPIFSRQSERCCQRPATSPKKPSNVTVPGKTISTMAPPAGNVGAYARRQAFRGASGPSAILKSGKAFYISSFACIGG